MGHAGDEFYLQDMVNCCVGCGAADGLLRFHVVPRAFRATFPAEFREHSSHDIVLLCLSCFPAAEGAANIHRLRLFSQVGGKFGSARHVIDPERRRIQKTAMALNKRQLPSNVRDEKLVELRGLLGKVEGDALTEEEICATCEMNVFVQNNDFVCPEKLVAQSLRLAEDPGFEQRCFEFVVVWRQLFVDAVKPQHLAMGWDVRRPLCKSAEQ